MTGRLLERYWNEICRDSRHYWGKLTDEDLAGINGQYALFVEALRRRYAFSRVKAEDELERFLFRYSDAPLKAEAPA